jgi:hypothetical protein
MSQIHLTRELLSKELFSDVMFVTLTAPGAMGIAGEVHFIKRDKSEYFFNFITEDLDLTDIEEYFPAITIFKRDSSPRDDWHRVYLGIGLSLGIKDEVFPSFKEYAKEYTQKRYMLFQNWRKAAYLALDAK